jgi:dihydrofolate reductase
MPADVAYFNQITAGKVFIMGRRTYESPNAFYSDKRNIVISHRPLTFLSPGTCIAGNLSEALALADSEEEVFVIGGAVVFENAMDLADTIYLTVIKHDFAGDAFFPVIDNALWFLYDQTGHTADEQNPFDYSFLIFKRR